MHLLKGIVFAWVVLCCSGEMARLYTKNVVGTITSSTLSWNSFNFGDSIPLNAIPIGNGGPIWCRSFSRGIWISGVVIDGSCHAPFFGQVEITDNYDVLVSVNGSARLLNVPWDSLTAFPLNPVSTPNMLLALSNDAEIGVVLPGYVNPEERRAHFLKGNSSMKLTGGFLVTEDEPIEYELSDVRLNDKTKKTNHEEVLLELTLENPTEFPEEVFKEISFLSPYQTYFGKVKGTVMGLHASVHGPDTTPVNVTWGTNNNLDKKRNHVVSYNLPAGTKVSIQLIAVVRVIDGSYGGTLTSLYKDGERIKRRIEGLHMERRLAKLRAEYSQVKYIADNSPVHQLPPQTMILLHSSTTAMPPLTELVAEGSENQLLPRPLGIGINGAHTRVSNLSLSLWIFLLLSYLLK